MIEDKEFRELSELVDEALENNHRLNSWETNFMTEMGVKLNEYGTKAIISAKQWETIENIERKLFTT